MKKKLILFISGRGSNMEAIIKACESGILKDKAEVILVLANKESAKGLETAQAKGIPNTCIVSKGKDRKSYEQELLEFLKKYPTVDYILLAGFMRILSPFFVKHYEGKIINIHPADTQQHQGLNGYQWAFEQGMKSTCITIHYVDEGLDSGNIIAQQIVDLEGADNLKEIEARGLKVEHELYSKAILSLIQ